MGVDYNTSTGLIYNSTGMILFYVAAAITLLASLILRAVHKKYAGVENNKHITGREVAEKILASNGLTNIKVGQISESLTDYYNNSTQEIRLSESVYDDTSIAAIAVAAHECGHAIQYKDGYGPIKARNAVAKVASIGNTIGYISLVIGLLASITGFIYIGVALMFFALSFQLVTLPVEYNASNRARKELLRLGIIGEDEVPAVKKMLNAAAFTYVAGLLSSVLQIIRLLSYARKK
ncbi:MAG: zinc metallopeptidase [Bacilli bacterium]|nr:zinc metallopeptidase [Bacilli bacterium]